jgi:hypothetical protein
MISPAPSLIARFGHSAVNFAGAELWVCGLFTNIGTWAKDKNFSLHVSSVATNQE